MINLGKLKEIKDLRKVWPHEAYRHTPIKISSYLTTVSKWGEDEILARAEMLSDELITIWKYPKKD